MNEPLARTPLHELHVELGGRMVPFAGYEMPVQYEGVVKEHHAVRGAVGLFDVSHMGELWLRGPQAQAVADSLVTNAIDKLKVGRAKYTVACNSRGTILDDLIVYRPSEEAVLIVCNASNRAKIAAHVAKYAEGECEFADESDDSALIALQGPKAVATAKAAGAPEAMLELRPFRLTEVELGGVKAIAARTGYTGEDGFEMLCASDDAPALWRHLMEAGEAHGIRPAGLGARDTLRLEACLCLYGNDIDETTNPFEAGLGWVVKLKRGDFLGRSALLRIQEEGPSRKLVGIEMTGRGIARHGYPILDAGGDRIGEVTSGSPGPTVGKNIGLGYVPVEHAEIGTPLGIEIRGKVVDAVVAKTPFYERQ
ncbi:MAG TPA: glycine cleavage system aminomethyltransferase GcvT [Sandaracinaceae bacterium LLY-WYZ-13_1]|nr:glycine cleavage system aminomethyltransferase GcvT [Sandaracinaceae bacterium LLY-WYZ-13_1]